MTKLGTNKLVKSQIAACIVSGDQQRPGIISADELLKQVNMDSFRKRCLTKASRLKRQKKVWRDK